MLHVLFDNEYPTYDISLWLLTGVHTFLYINMIWCCCFVCLFKLMGTVIFIMFQLKFILISCAQELCRIFTFIRCF